MKRRAYSRAIWAAAFMSALVGAQIFPAAGRASELIGSKLPDFPLVLANGQAVKLSSFRGRLLVLVFFMDTCAPCRAEVPEFNKLYEEHKDKIMVLGVGYGMDNRYQLAGTARDWGIRYPVCLDPGHDLLRAFKVSGFPFSALLDRSGRVIHALYGYAPGAMGSLAVEFSAWLENHRWPPELILLRFKNISAPARKEDTASRVKEALRTELPKKGIPVVKDFDKAELVVSGEVTKSGSQVGVEMVFKCQGVDLDYLKIYARSSAEDYSKLAEQVAEKLKQAYQLP